jgi:hypothetical protein
MITGIPVTPENYVEAEVDVSAATIVPEVGSNKFRHDRSLMPLDKQPAVTMNRDTVYSFGMFYTPKGDDDHAAAVEGQPLPVGDDDADRSLRRPRLLRSRNLHHRFADRVHRYRHSDPGRRNQSRRHRVCEQSAGPDHRQAAGGQ